MKHEYLRLSIVLVILIGIVIIFALTLSAPLWNGKETVLATQPVDPFDVFRGQYLTIRYEIGMIPALSDIEQGERVYVVLEKDENMTARYVRATRTKPDEALFIRGTVDHISGEEMFVNYGIEQYFFERNAQIVTTNMQVKVKIGSNGQARIVELVRDGEPIEIVYENVSIRS